MRQEANKMFGNEMAGEVARSSPLAAIEARSGDYAISIKEAAKILTLSTRTVWRLIEDQKLHAVRLSERRRGILASELSRYMTAEAA
jgi:excisionase family DNA binding protein